MTEAGLRELVGSLQGELQALREVAAAHAEVADRLEQLREANQNLVLATVSADNRRDEAEQANRRQNEFLAMLAHELRNPLAPISMAATLLERVPDASPQLRQLQNVIGRQVEQMARLLDDLLDAARISSGKITLTLEPVLLADVIERAVETVAPRIAERGQALALSIPGQAIVIEGNRVRLTQVFSNLLSNASKYTQDGGEIAFAAECDGDTVRVTLRDNGTGIAADVIPHIFDLFTQGPRSLARSEGGLGVGLNVVRNLVHMHGGEVTAHSVGLGAGSTFTVTLPVSTCVPDRQDPPEGRPEGAASWGIVLVEDNVDACDTLHAFLSFAGHSVRSTYTGTSGLEAALLDSCDVLVCDIGLPGLDGYSLVRALRAARPGRRPYAIALSGYCQPEDRVLALEAGFDEFMVKPADPAALLALIAEGAALLRAGDA
ncbi:MAG TPA: hybrid sensor histidine kinase/response regulator [Telluria sp.]|nr:hybrid sensor histidine kinase/response regulator [Telluria sp.]